MRKHKTISLWEPYASLIAWGVKRYETRSWHPGNRLRPGETLLIHAAKRKPGDYETRLYQSPLIRPLFDERGITLDDLPYGCIIAAVRYVDAHPTNLFQPSGIERVIGNYQPDRYAWELELARVAETPIPATGQQGIWLWSQEMIR